MACPTILFTGATGFIGGATAVELLLRRPTCSMLFIVRGENTEIAEARLQKSLSQGLRIKTCQGSEIIPNRRALFS